MQNNPGMLRSRGFKRVMRQGKAYHGNTTPPSLQSSLRGGGTARAVALFATKAHELFMAERRKKAARKTAVRKSPHKAAPKRWSQRVARESDALDLQRGVFKLTSAKKIAASLKRSAERSTRRKSGAYRSALSMLIFYMNRAGKNLPKTERERLERAKVELKHQFGRE